MESHIGTQVKNWLLNILSFSGKNSGKNHVTLAKPNSFAAMRIIQGAVEVISCFSLGISGI